MTFEIHAVTPDRLADLADLFAAGPATRGCWCMWFIDTSAEVQARWRDGGNRRAFEELAQTADPPLGLLAYDEDGLAVGWVATGPRSRYPRAIGPRSTIMKGRDPSEDDDVWLLPCFFVRPHHRGSNTTGALLAAAVEHARAHGASAVEGWPIADSYAKSQDDFVGKQRRFAECGFECVATPTPRRVIMRRDLG